MRTVGVISSSSTLVLGRARSTGRRARPQSAAPSTCAPSPGSSCSSLPRWSSRLTRTDRKASASAPRSTRSSAEAMGCCSSGISPERRRWAGTVFSIERAHRVAAVRREDRCARTNVSALVIAPSKRTRRPANPAGDRRRFGWTHQRLSRFCSFLRSEQGKAYLKEACLFIRHTLTCVWASVRGHREWAAWHASLAPQGAFTSRALLCVFGVGFAVV